MNAEINPINAPRVKLLSEACNSDMSNVIHKMNTEAGELTEAYLAYSGWDGASIRAEGSPMDILGEACDVANCAIGIMYDIARKHGYSDYKIADMFEKKLDKWENKIAK